MFTKIAPTHAKAVPFLGVDSNFFSQTHKTRLFWLNIPQNGISHPPKRAPTLVQQPKQHRSNSSITIQQKQAIRD